MKRALLFLALVCSTALALPACEGPRDYDGFPDDAAAGAGVQTIRQGLTVSAPFVVCPYVGTAPCRQVPVPAGTITFYLGATNTSTGQNVYSGEAVYVDVANQPGRRVTIEDVSGYGIPMISTNHIIQVVQNLTNFSEYYNHTNRPSPTGFTCTYFWGDCRYQALFGSTAWVVKDTWGYLRTPSWPESFYADNP